MGWAEIKNNHQFEVLSSFNLCNNYKASTNHFLIRLWHAMKSGLYMTTNSKPAQWLDQEEGPKYFPKPNLYQKRLWSPFGGLLPVWPTTAFWIPEKPFHLRSVLSKSMGCTKNCNDCSWPWWTERAQFFSMTMSEPALQKLNELGFEVLPHPP